tara:strand:+ start:4189 stop:5523 length:1335 start_codon:yes stop_codon:yes gene_type:complete
MELNKIYFYPISIIIALFLYSLLFSFGIIIPDYSFGDPRLCVEIVEYEIGKNGTLIKYPFSCDQNYYYSGFENFSEVFKETYNYQSRPIFILGGFIFYNLVNVVVNLFNLNFEYTTQLSTFLYQLLIINAICYLLYKSFSTKFKFSNFDYLSLLVFIMLNPIYKWGMFVPSHQSATLLLIAFFIFYASKKDIEIDYKISIFFGAFFLFHRGFLISYLALVLFKNLKYLKIRETYIKNSYLFLYFLLPNIIYESFIRFVLQRSTYDANTEYWGQFIWLFDFIRGKIRYVSEWHCVTIPENFICYLNDFKRMTLYIFIPIFIILIIFLTNFFIEKNIKYNFLYETLFITISLFLFWSLIGWYPPVRFNFYSIGHLVTLLFVIQYVHEKNILNKLTILLMSITSYILIPHWNIPNPQINFGIFEIVSSLILFIYIILKILERKKEHS